MAKIHGAHHELGVQAALGALHLDVLLEFTAPWTVLFGPSGSGKSSLLRAICGLPFGDPHARVSFERHETDGTWHVLTGLPVHRRDIAYAPQRSALFPHLTVRENVGFPYKVCSTPVNDSSIVDDCLTLFKLHALCDRLPAQLSGGERQRVNLARAFATPSARLMLLDEPFTGVDRGQRDELLTPMRQWMEERGIPAISVTHDVDEALLLGAHVIVLREGHVEREGPGAEALAGELARMSDELQSFIA